MAKYYLKQNTKKVEGYIDFSKIEGFEKLDSTKLKDIDSFTSIFKNDEELKFYLCQKGLIDLDNVNSNLNIIYRYNKADKKVPYGLVFNDDLRLFNEQEMKNFLHESIYNFDLLKKLCNRFDEYYGQEMNIHVLRNHIALFEDGNMQYSLPGSEKEYLINMYKNAINRFVHGIVTKYNNKKKEEVENYRGFRDLAMFLNKRLKEIEEEKMKKIIAQQDLEKAIEEHRNETEEFLTGEDFKRMRKPSYKEFYKGMDIEQEKEIKKEKTKIKTKQFNIPGQLTFEDMGWK